MKNPNLVLEIQNNLASKNIESLHQICASNHPGVVADSLSELGPLDIWTVISLLNGNLQSDIVGHLDKEIQTNIVLNLSREDSASLLTNMSADDRVDLFLDLTEEQRESLYPALAKAEREDIRRLMTYPEESAGSVMTSEYVALRKDMTAAQAMNQIRLEAPTKETIYYAYVVDIDRKLIGFISLKDLILVKPDAVIGDFMHKEVIHAQVDDDQEDAARIIQKYDLIALPVTNNENVLAGIITHDDAIDIITQEQQEDIEKFMAIQGTHKAWSYLKTPAWVHFKNRAYWIVSLAALGLVSGIIIHSFEATLTHLLILALYMPMLADTGGNTGSQSATVIVRALALGEIRTKDIFRVLFKEFQVSILLSVVLGILSWGKVMFLSQDTKIPHALTLGKIGFVIALALSLQVITATLIGAILPIGAAKMKWDPAVVASPALTTIVDITGLLLYFGMAKLMLGI